MVTVNYLDASAWLKRYVDEQGSSWVNDLFDGDPSIATASLGAIEVRAAVARRRRNGGIGAGDYAAFVKDLIRDEAHIETIHLTDDVFTAAKRLPGVYSLRGSGTLHLASAMAYRNARPSHRVVMVTSDLELADAARHAMFTVVDPTNPASYEA